ncbi:hypothetical protein [Thalassospira alkalitolerans]|nr:hypothetical protein [Thalassospira alkalitolerans]
MIFVAAGLDGVSQQTVTVKPDFSKEATGLSMAVVLTSEIV